MELYRRRAGDGDDRATAVKRAKARVGFILTLTNVVVEVVGLMDQQCSGGS